MARGRFRSFCEGGAVVRLSFRLFFFLLLRLTLELQELARGFG